MQQPRKTQENTANPANPDKGVQSLPLLPPKSSSGRQGFVRVINRSIAQGEVQIYAVDDEGNRRGPVSLTLDGGAAAHFNSSDLEDGNASKRLRGRIGAGAGDWRLELTSDLDVEVLGYVRTDDGFLTAMQEIAPRRANRHRIAVFNPGSNTDQVSMLRLVNPTQEPARISIRSIDDAGDAGGRVELTLPAGQARTYSAWELESGGGDLKGSLGEGAGQVATGGGIRTARARHEPARKPDGPSDQPVGRPLSAHAPGYGARRFR